MGNNLHLITKVLFDPEFFYPEKFIKIKTGDYIKNAIIVANEGEQLTVVVIQKSVNDGEELHYEPILQCIDAEQVASGDIELLSTEERCMNTEALDKIYVAFRETSNLLCEQEKALAEKMKTKNQGDIDARNDKRLSAFRELMNEICN